MEPKIITLVVGYVRTNCYIVYEEEGGECVVIDPGSDPEKIIGTLREHNLTPRYIFLTHGHFDHILAVGPVQEEWHCPIVIHREDAACLTDPAKSLAPPPLRKKLNNPEIIPTEDGAVFSVRNLSFQWIHTPGHTLGSSCILCKAIAFTGDTLFKKECGRCDLAGGDFPTMLRSLKRLYDLSGDYTILPGHDAKTTLEAERRENPYILQALAETAEK